MGATVNQFLVLQLMFSGDNTPNRALKLSYKIGFLKNLVFF